MGAGGVDAFLFLLPCFSTACIPKSNKQKRYARQGANGTILAMGDCTEVEGNPLPATGQVLTWLTG